MTSILFRTIECPYCGERFETAIDTSGGPAQYIEDCQVCCRPIVFMLEVDHEGRLEAVEVRREDD